MLMKYVRCLDKFAASVKTSKEDATDPKVSTRRGFGLINASGDTRRFLSYVIVVPRYYLYMGYKNFKHIQNAKKWWYFNLDAVERLISTVIQFICRLFRRTCAELKCNVLRFLNEDHHKVKSYIMMILLTEFCSLSSVCQNDFKLSNYSL